MRTLILLPLLALAACSSCPPGFGTLSSSTAVIVADNEAYIAADAKLTDGEKVAARLRNREAASLAAKLAGACK